MPNNNQIVAHGHMNDDDPIPIKYGTRRGGGRRPNSWRHKRESAPHEGRILEPPDGMSIEDDLLSTVPCSLNKNDAEPDEEMVEATKAS